MADQNIFLDDDWNIVAPEQATMVKVIKDDGSVVFGRRQKIEKNVLLRALNSVNRILARRLQGNKFEDHRGRPGQRGGSLPKSAGTGPTPKSSVADQHAAKIAAEPKITEQMEKLAADSGGELYGLDNRMKELDSFTRKAKTDALEKGITEEEAAAQINDAIRYTITYKDHTVYTDSVKKAEQDLLDAGYTRFDHKRKNFYAQENAVYQGYNTVWTTPDGENFEVQFHTAKSLELKSRGHNIYKQMRTTQDQAARAQYASQMMEVWKDPEYTKPVNYESLLVGD